MYNRIDDSSAQNKVEKEDDRGLWARQRLTHQAKSQHPLQS
jgi:hypothetical protein